MRASNSGFNLRWSKVSSQDVLVAEADAAGFHFDQDLAALQLGDRQVLDLERLGLTNDDRGLVSLWQIGGHDGGGC